MYTATIECAENSDQLYKALMPEATKTSRFELAVTKGKDTVKISIRTKDATAFKAVTTSIIRLLETAEKIDVKK